MFGFQETLNISLSQLEAKCKTDEDRAKLLENLETIIPEFIDETAESCGGSQCLDHEMGKIKCFRTVAADHHISTPFLDH